MVEDKGMEKDAGPSGSPTAPVSFTGGGNAPKKDGGKSSKTGQNQNPLSDPAAADFLMKFLEANPDIAKEMHTRMQAVINKGQVQQGQQAGPPQQGGMMQPQQPPPPQPQMGSDGSNVIKFPSMNAGAGAGGA